ncbi:MAG: hypothetical protein JXL81_05100, partial [Deltaproteobacteria bacterium]|nr:hypothetical protein [Deltaproteobacteria bacterium]
ERLPQPTPYINSRICANGHQKIKKAVSSLLKSRTEKFNGKAFEIIITLKPETFENGYQKRNIVKEHVVLPIRYVIFRPIEVQILDETEIIK